MLAGWLVAHSASPMRAATVICVCFCFLLGGRFARWLAGGAQRGPRARGGAQKHADAPTPLKRSYACCFLSPTPLKRSSACFFCSQAAGLLAGWLVAHSAPPVRAAALASAGAELCAVLEPGSNPTDGCGPAFFLDGLWRASSPLTAGEEASTLVVRLGRAAASQSTAVIQV